MDLPENNRILRDFEAEPALEKDYPAMGEAVDWLLPGLTMEQHDIVMTLILRTCEQCREEMQPCNCWNDD